MASSQIVVTAVAGHSLWPNMEVELNTFGELLDGHIERHLVVGEHSISESLRGSFDLVYPVEPPFPDYRGIRYAFRATRRYLNEYRPDFIFNIAQQIPVGFAVALAGCRKAGVTTILRVAGEPFRQHELEEAWFRRFRKWMVHWKGVEFAGQMADAVLTLGPTLRSQIVESGISPAKVYALPNFFDHRRFQRSSEPEEEMKGELGLEPSRKTVLFVGRVSEMKGADRLLEIVRCVVRESEDIQFCILGDGPLLQEFRQFPSSRVHLAGRVPYTDVPNYYRASDLLIHPSKTEGLPNVVLEAIAARLPVMAAPVGEIQRYVPKTASEPQVYVEYILRGEWEPPAYPNWFDREVLRERYLSFFNNLVSKEP
ncbi:hypothetical protein BRC21_00600 [Candidatus Saccharibacteria bacterium SW_7_54_9]|nr:MAG: hypothetical protein BRC21_00600 [Candidatus Saccharibacteria bacterium SW_7_54_9]